MNRFTNLKILFSFSYKLKERVSKCWNKSKTKPTPNSIAENIRKKNVRDNKLRLSYINPINKVTTYKVIQRSSAVKRRCKAVLVVLKKVLKSKKKRRIKVFKSPKNKINKEFIFKN